MRIAYYIDENYRENLYCRVSDHVKSVSFPTGHTVDPVNWDYKNEEVSSSDPYYSVLLQLKLYVHERYYAVKRHNVTTATILETLSSEIETVVKGAGIEGIARKLFDEANRPYGIPAYDLFVQAFQQFSGLKRAAFTVNAITSVVQFNTVGQVSWEIDTYEGLTTRLGEVFDKRLFCELCEVTSRTVWRDVFSVNTITKSLFIPKLLTEWDSYWNVEYADMQQKLGGTSHLDERKQISWRYFQVFMDCYENGRNIIDLAYEISDEDLYPLVVITMLTLIDARKSFHRYCELAFDRSKGWKPLIVAESGSDCSLTTSAITVNSSVFFVREVGT